MNKKIAIYSYEDLPIDSLVQHYENTGAPFIPLKVQLLWFRKIFPNGKIRTTEPTRDPEKTTGTFVSTAYIYKDAGDPLDNYLASASSKRTTAEGDDFDGFETAQSAAISKALERAGFMAPMTEEELKAKAKETLNLPPENEGTEKKEEILEETEAPAPKAESETPEIQEAPETKEDIQKEEDEQPAASKPLEEEVKHIFIEEGETEQAELVLTKEDSMEALDSPENNGDASNEEKDAAHNEQDETEAVAKEEEPAPVEAPLDKEAEMSDLQKEELEAARQIHIEYCGYNLTFGELEERITEELKSNEKSSKEFLLWLSTSNSVKKKVVKYYEAAKMIVSIHPEWTADI